MSIRLLCILLLGFSGMAQGIVTLSQSNTLWTIINGNYDFITDQQTGQGQADIVGGTGSDAGFMTAFDNNGGNTSLTDGFLAFRVRMNAQDGQQTPDFSNYLWIGIEANGNDAIDGFLNYHGGNQAAVGIFAPGTGANTSPSTTTISNTAYVSYTTVAQPTYSNYRQVNGTGFAGEAANNDVVGGDGNPDWYVSFQLPFQDIVNYMATRGITMNENTALRYVLGTSTQGNSLNQDLGGVQGGTSSTTTWSQIPGGFTPTMTGGGTVIPEPSAALLCLLSCGAWVMRRRR